jgi:hypothetical protein
MECEMAEILLTAAAGAALPYALTAAAHWLRGNRLMHRNGRCAPFR